MLENFRNSPRLQRRALIASLAVFATGVVVVVVFVVLPSKTNALNAPISTQKADVVKNDPQAPVDPAAIDIGRKFLATAVVRKNLNWAYDNVHVNLKGRMSRAEWNKGNIPVVPFDAQNAASTAFIPVFHLQKEVEFRIDLVPKAHAVYAGKRPVQFFIALERERDKAGGRWLVSYFEPDYKPPVPLSQ